jgi:nondiscriminating glutamyl-tRNA synthetase
LALPYLQEVGIMPQGEISEQERTWVTQYVQAIINHLSYMAQVKDFVHYFHGAEAPAPEGEALEIIKGEQVPEVLSLLASKLKDLDQITVENTKPLLKQITKELKLGGKQVFMPIRIALTGQMHGPELYDIIPLLGLENVLSRLEHAKKLL